MQWPVGKRNCGEGQREGMKGNARPLMLQGVEALIDLHFRIIWPKKEGKRGCQQNIRRLIE